MSHNPERKEKDCLNCGAEVIGHYCHVCGQANVETKESFWSLTKHFVYDIFHFDGKFVHTLGYIFSKPGFVAKEYVAGKRASHLHPIRMYLFTSAVFFLFFFSLELFKVGKGNLNAVLDKKDREEWIQKYEAELKARPGDTSLPSRIALLKDTTTNINIDSLGWGEDFLRVAVFGNRSYASLAQYDSAQASLPEAQRDAWLKKLFFRQTFRAKSKYGGNEGTRTFFETLLHKLPYLLFVSLPFFAGILKLLYVRRRNFLYSDHAVFTLYHYIFSFLLLLVGFLFNALGNATGLGIFGTLAGLLAIVWPVYLFLEMRRFYGQGFGKTLVKFIALNVLGFFLILFLAVFFAIFSFFQS